jgi:hypothetical protein
MATFDDFFGTSLIGANPFLTSINPPAPVDPNNASNATFSGAPEINPNLQGLSAQASRNVTSGGGAQSTYTPPNYPGIPSGGKTRPLTQEEWAQQQRVQGLAPQIPSNMVRYGNTMIDPNFMGGALPVDPYPIKGTVDQQIDWLKLHAFDTYTGAGSGLPTGSGARTSPDDPTAPRDPNLPPDPGTAQPRPPSGVGSSGSGTGGGANTGASSTGQNSGAFVGDLGPIRNQLQNFLLQHFKDTTTPYGGNLNIPQSPYIGQGAGAAQQAMQLYQNVFNDASRTSDRLAPFWDQAWGAAAQAGTGTTDFTNEMMRTGGAPDITQALADIRTKGMGDLADQLAQIKEQYGQWGLGRSSDINEGLARGASRGIADINQQQSTLAASIMDAAAQRKLGAAGLQAQTQAQGASMLNNLLGTFNNTIQSTLQNQIGAAGGIAGAGQSLMGAGAADAQRLMQNTLLPYQEFMRTSQQYPFMNDALAFATGFPPSNPTVKGGIDWGALLGGAAGSLIPLLALA